MASHVPCGSGIFDGHSPAPCEGTMTFQRASLFLFVQEDRVYTGDHQDRGLTFLGGKALDDELPRPCAQRELSETVLFQ